MTSKKNQERIFTLNDPRSPRLNAALAKEIGLNESIMLLQLEFWISISNNIRNGKRWTYQSTREMQGKAFPFWSIMTINRIIQSLEKKRLIESTLRYNEFKYDKTRWFSLNFQELMKLNSVTIKEYNTDLYQLDTDSNKKVKQKNQEDTNDMYQLDTRSNHFDTRSNHFDTRSNHFGTTIPDITTDITTDTTATAGKNAAAVPFSLNSFPQIQKALPKYVVVNQDVEQWFDNALKTYPEEVLTNKIAYAKKRCKQPEKFFGYLSKILDEPQAIEIEIKKEQPKPAPVITPPQNDKSDAEIAAILARDDFEQLFEQFVEQNKSDKVIARICRKIEKSNLRESIKNSYIRFNLLSFVNKQAAL